MRLSGARRGTMTVLQPQGLASDADPAAACLAGADRIRRQPGEPDEQAGLPGKHAASARFSCKDTGAADRSPAISALESVAFAGRQAGGRPR